MWWLLELRNNQNRGLHFPCIASLFRFICLHIYSIPCLSAYHVKRKVTDSAHRSYHGGRCCNGRPRRRKGPLSFLLADSKFLLPRASAFVLSFLNRARFLRLYCSVLVVICRADFSEINMISLLRSARTCQTSLACSYTQAKWPIIFMHFLRRPTMLSRFTRSDKSIILDFCVYGFERDCIF